MLKLGSRVKAIGTPVTCPACRYPNPGINIWCERCRTPLDWKPVAKPTPDRVELPRRRRAFTFPRLTMPATAWLRVRPPVFTVPRPRLPHVPRIALVVAAILAVLLIVPLAYVLLPAGRAAVENQAASGHLPSTNGATAADTPQAAAIPGVEAKTHLHYSTGKCEANTPCLTVASETMGKDAAAVVFSTASSAARQCVGYVYRSAGRWHFLSAVCGLPNQLSPLVDHDATVRIAGGCANVREGPGLKAHVVACLNDGTTLHIDGGPTYADSRLWWHHRQGWMAQDFLTGP
jgi:hypothetical protein